MNTETHSMATEPATSTASSSESLYLGVIKALSIGAVIAFFAGWFITIIASLVVNYYEIPNMGVVRTNAQGNEVFQPYYPDFRKYAVETPNSRHRTEESKFSQIGMLGTGLYIYSISNAFHWMLELKFQNFGVILLFPFFMITGSMILVYIKWLPKSQRQAENMVPYTVGMSAIHALLVLLFVGLFAMTDSTFYSLYDDRYIYVGQLLGLALPSAFIILGTNLFFGAVAGALLNFIASIGLLPQAR